MKKKFNVIARWFRTSCYYNGFISEGSKYWYYYMNIDRVIDREKNIDKPHDVIERRVRGVVLYGVKKKGSDNLRGSFFKHKPIAQLLVDMENDYVF